VLHRLASGGEVYPVSLISTSDMERYRAIVATIDVPDAQKDEMIGIVFSMMQHFTAIAFGLDDTQLSLGKQNGFSSLEGPPCASVDFNSTHEIEDLAREGAVNTHNTFGGEDEGQQQETSGHLLPR
jgi:hypothetical protein